MPESRQLQGQITQETYDLWSYNTSPAQCSHFQCKPHQHPGNIKILLLTRQIWCHHAFPSGLYFLLLHELYKFPKYCSQDICHSTIRWHAHYNKHAAAYNKRGHLWTVKNLIFVPKKKKRNHIDNFSTACAKKGSTEKLLPGPVGVHLIEIRSNEIWVSLETSVIYFFAIQKHYPADIKFKTLIHVC